MIQVGLVLRLGKPPSENECYLILPQAPFGKINVYGGASKGNPGPAEAGYITTDSDGVVLGDGSSHSWKSRRTCDYLAQKWQSEWTGMGLPLNVEVMELNLLSLESVVRFAEAWNSRATRIFKGWIRRTHASEPSSVGVTLNITLAVSY